MFLGLKQAVSFTERCITLCLYLGGSGPLKEGPLYSLSLVTRLHPLHALRKLNVPGDEASIPLCYIDTSTCRMKCIS